MKKELMDYFKTVLDYYGKYHNHKEVSAWAGLVLQIAFCAFAIRFPLNQSKHKISLALTFVCVIVIVAILIFVYIKNQLEMKDKGGAWAGAALFFLTEV